MCFAQGSKVMFAAVIAFVFLGCFLGATQDHELEPRFIQLMGLSSFPRIECVVDDLRRGTCLPFNDCRSKGGLPAVFCSFEIAWCCLFQVTCGGTVTYNTSHFVNPKFPGYDNTFHRKDCLLTVSLSPDVCYLKLDFIEFNITQPNSSTGRCRKDSFRVPKKSEIPIICGENAGQHMYIYVGGMETVQLAFRLDTGCNFPRVWNILIQYFLCAFPERPCGNCLQYYTAPSGYVRSFNFYYLAAPHDADEYWDPVPANASRLAKMNYWICVRLTSGYCSIQWSAGVFDMSGDDNNPLAETGQACGNDFVFIPEGKTADGLRAEKFCGNRLNFRPTNTSVPIESKFFPLQIRVITSSRRAKHNPNRGFCLSYKLLECPVADEYDPDTY